MKRDYRFFEQWARRNQMRPICRVEDEHADILIADSGEPIVSEGKQVYRTAFAIDRDKTWLASTAETSVIDPEMLARTPRGAQEYRVNEALAHARRAISETHATGLYDGKVSSY